MGQPLCSNMSNKKRGSWRNREEKPHDAISSSNESKHLVTEEIHVYMHTVLYKASTSEISFRTDERNGSCQAANGTHFMEM